MSQPEQLYVTVLDQPARDPLTGPAIARGQSGSPYDWICAIGALAYLGAVGLLRWRG